MLGEFINSVLVIILGFAYPALECFKTMEKSRVQMSDLRFWCQYWIIVAILSVFERFGDIFISWVPMYAELKLGFIIYLWYPKTKGTRYVYESLLRPFVTRHETDIDKHLEELRLRVWDLGIYYWQNCTELGQGAYFQVIDYLMKQSRRGGEKKSNSNGKLNKVGGGVRGESRPAQPSAPPMPVFSLFHRSVVQPRKVYTAYVQTEEEEDQWSPKRKARLGWFRILRSKQQ